MWSGLGGAMKDKRMEPEKVLSILDDLVNSLQGVLSDEDFEMLQRLLAEAWGSWPRMIPKADLKELLQADDFLVLTAEEASEILKWIESLEAGDCRFHCRSKRKK